jgi:hypothetical protein
MNKFYFKIITYKICFCPITAKPHITIGPAWNNFYLIDNPKTYYSHNIPMNLLKLETAHRNIISKNTFSLQSANRILQEEPQTIDPTT